MSIVSYFSGCYLWFIWADWLCSVYPKFFFPIRVECSKDRVVGDLQWRCRKLHAKNKQVIPIQFDHWNMVIVTVLENDKWIPGSSNVRWNGRLWYACTGLSQASGMRVSQENRGTYLLNVLFRGWNGGSGALDRVMAAFMAMMWVNHKFKSAWLDSLYNVTRRDLVESILPPH